MTPVQLPEVPEPFIELITHAVYDAWAAQLREYATAAVLADRERVEALAAHPSACELGADTARLDWLEANCVDVADEYGTGSQLYFGTYATAPLRTAIDRAPQHRGDSQEADHG